MCFYNAESCALHGLGTDESDDIVIRLDTNGFIDWASSNASALGFDFASLLLMPHISDLAQPEFADEIAAYCTQVLEGDRQGGWLEFPLPEREMDDGEGRLVPNWYALSLRAISEGTGAVQGAMGLLRSAQHKHALAQDISAQASSEPVTGLANRKTFCAALTRLIGSPSSDNVKPNALAVFAIDGMRAIFMQHGQSTADEIRWGFSRFLETMATPTCQIAQLDEERVGVVIEGMPLRDAREWAGGVIRTFAELTIPSRGRAPELTASAGLARLEVSADWTMRQAELGLVMARAGGGGQTSVCQPSIPVTRGHSVERAMETALQRAAQRRG